MAPGEVNKNQKYKQYSVVFKIKDTNYFNILIRLIFFK